MQVGCTRCAGRAHGVGHVELVDGFIVGGRFASLAGPLGMCRGKMYTRI